jgi:hypothetical protein
VVNFHQYGTTHLYLLFINLGIQMTSCLGKLFTSLLQKRLEDFLESKTLLVLIKVDSEVDIKQLIIFTY